MKIYLASIATNESEIENRAYKDLKSALNYIYESLKSLTAETIPDSDFFDREYIQKYFTEAIFTTKVNCKSEYGEFVIEKVKNNRYQFVFIFYPSLLAEPIDFFIGICYNIINNRKEKKYLEYL